MWPGRPEFTEIRRMCVELRTAGMTLKAIAVRVRTRIGRSFSSQAVAYHLRPRDSHGRVCVGVSNPPSGWLHIATVRRVLGVSMEQIQAHLFPRHELRVKWNSPGPRYLFAEDVARVWPARWRRAVERAATDNAEFLGETARRVSPNPEVSIAPAVPSLHREFVDDLVDIGSERPVIAVWRYGQYRSDVLYPRVVLAVAEILDERGAVDAVEVLTRMGLLVLSDVERWCLGQADCLERLLGSPQTVARAARVLGILRMHAIERGLVAKRGVFLSHGDEPRVLLQFTYDEDVNLETAYQTLYVQPSVRKAHLERAGGFYRGEGRAASSPMYNR